MPIIAEANTKRGVSNPYLPTLLLPLTFPYCALPDNGISGVFIEYRKPSLNHYQ
jgi:hypothetical protein